MYARVATVHVQVEKLDEAIKIYRDGRPMTLNVVIGRRPGRVTIADMSPGTPGDVLPRESLGIRIGNLNSQLALDADLRQDQQPAGARGALADRDAPVRAGRHDPDQSRQ